MYYRHYRKKLILALRHSFPFMSVPPGLMLRLLYLINQCINRFHCSRGFPPFPSDCC